MGPTTSHAFPHERDVLRRNCYRLDATLHLEFQALPTFRSFQRSRGRHICHGIFGGASTLDVDFFSS